MKAPQKDPPTTIADGVVVTVHYELRDDGGEVLDQSGDDEPFDYLHGAENIVPGLENALTGHAAGERLEVVVPPEEGYGLPSETPAQPVDRHQFPDDMTLEPGMPVVVEDEDGDALPLWIERVDDEHVWLGLDHPLAGVTLTFAVEIVALRASTDEEREHGHPHGPDGHGHHH